MISKQKLIFIIVVFMLLTTIGMVDTPSYGQEMPTYKMNVLAKSFLSASVPRDCQDIHIAHPSWGNGYYIIDPDGQQGYPAFEAYCDMSTDGGGWTVIDYAHTHTWPYFFTTWQVFDNNRMARPTGSGLPSPSWDYWVNWFILADTNTKFRISPSCQEVASVDFLAQAYVTSGDVYECRWFNRNCDMDPDTQACFECADPWGRVSEGTCSHLIQDATNTDRWGIYKPYNYSCSFDWWNHAPAVGINGEHCVAYRDARLFFSSHLPFVVRADQSNFPIFVSDAIPWRDVIYPGEVFFTTTIRIPTVLSPDGHFYFSSSPDAAVVAVVDDELAMIAGGTEIFTYDFSSSGSLTPAVVEVPRSTMEQLAGKVVTIEYRDKYDVAVSASPIWLIWAP